MPSPPPKWRNTPPQPSTLDTSTTRARPQTWPGSLYPPQPKTQGPDLSRLDPIFCATSIPPGREAPAMSDTTTTTAPTRFQCRHIFTDGHRCGSPCLRNEQLCYFHHTTRRPPAPSPHPRRRRAAFDLPLLEDRSAVQAALNQILGRLAANTLDPRRAGLLLYGLQIAGANLPQTARQPSAPRSTPSWRQARSLNAPAPRPELTVEEITSDPALGTLAPPAPLETPARKQSIADFIIEDLRRTQERKAAEAAEAAKLAPDTQETPAPSQEEPAPNPPAILPTLQGAAEPPQPQPQPSKRSRLAAPPASRLVNLRFVPLLVGREDNARLPGIRVQPPRDVTLPVELVSTPTLAELLAVRRFRRNAVRRRRCHSVCARSTVRRQLAPTAGTWLHLHLTRRVRAARPNNLAAAVNLLTGSLRRVAVIPHIPKDPDNQHQKTDQHSSQHRLTSRAPGPVSARNASSAVPAAAFQHTIAPSRSSR